MAKEPSLPPKHETWAEECAAGFPPAWLVLPVGSDLYLVDPDTDLSTIDHPAHHSPVMLRDKEREQLTEVLGRERAPFKWSWRDHLYTVHDARSAPGGEAGHKVLRRSVAGSTRQAPVL